MERSGLRSNYILSTVYLVLSLFLVCFAVAFTRGFLKELRVKDALDMSLFFFGLTSPFIFYTFIADLDRIYQRIQHFFFRSSFFSVLVPSLLVIAILAYTILPKIFNSQIDGKAFGFIGPMFASIHFIFVGRTSHQTTFTGFINYIFVLLLMYIVTLVFLEVYFAAGTEMNFFHLISEGAKGGLLIVKRVILGVTP